MVTGTTVPYLTDGVIILSKGMEAGRLVYSPSLFRRFAMFHPSHPFFTRSSSKPQQNLQALRIGIEATRQTA